MKIKTIIISVVILFLIIILLSSPIYSLIVDRKAIVNLINKKYSSYEIKDLQLEYVDWSSTVKSANESHSATRAIAIIENETEQRTLNLKKIFLIIWSISDSEPNYGPNVPNEVYFVDSNIISFDKEVDINEHIKYFWIIPDENGDLYKKYGDTKNWAYYAKLCNNIYKTKDGYVYVFNKDILDWEKSTITYAKLCYCANYEKVTKEYVVEIIENFIPYREH